MLTPNLFLVSDREDDSAFFALLAARLKWSFATVHNRDVLRNMLSIYPESIVVWSADFSEKSSSKEVSIPEILSKSIPTVRVFVVADEPLSKYPELTTAAPFFCHYIRRVYSDSAIDLYTRLLEAAWNPLHVNVKKFFPSGASGQKITLRRSSHRPAARGAIQTFFEKKGMKPRLASKIALAADELLMNAIYNAPVNSQGMHFRRMMNKSTTFDFGKTELVHLETIATKDIAAISVIDQFGTLKWDMLYRLLAKDYRSKNFQLKEYGPGSELGLYRVLEMGFSFLCSGTAGMQTDAMLLFPMAETQKQFRESFQFFCYFGDGGNALAKRARRF